MASAVVGWLREQDFSVKSEFVSPWGICDLVGLKFNRRRVAHRLRLRQFNAVGSITRASLLLEIPDIETKTGTTLARLRRAYGCTLSEEGLRKEVARLLLDRFVISSSRGRLQKVNGWMPLQERLIAVELKRSRIDEALRQARNNLVFANESYVAFPAHVVERIMSTRDRWDAYFSIGVGMLAVTKESCKIALAAKGAPSLTDQAIQLYCVDKFWRTRSRDS